MKRWFRAMLLAGALCLPLVATAAEKPKSVIHVVTLRWAEGTSPAKIAEVMTALETAAASYPDITRIWTRPLAVQGAPIGNCADCKPVTHAFVMEFASEDALKKYRNSDAQKAFYKVYMPLRDQSRTHDITN